MATVPALQWYCANCDQTLKGTTTHYNFYYPLQRKHVVSVEDFIQIINESSKLFQNPFILEKWY